MAPNHQLLFVYGTLRRGASRGGQQSPHALRLEREAAWLGEAKAAGRLYQVNIDYPGMVRASQPDQWVPGEVWAFSDAELWQSLDEYEGSEYVRVLRTVTLADGSKREAWVYLYASRITTAMARLAV